MNAGTTRLAALMAEAVEICISHVESGGIPFVGLLVGDDGWVSEPGVNLVRETGDRTAHAEIVAMREAARTRGLEGLTLLATGEPCGLCYRVAAAHGIAAVHFAVGRDDAAEWGFDYRAGYREADRLLLAKTAGHLAVDRGLAPFARYRALHHPDLTTNS
ncbi:tRNA(Arg) A34 adenosine deaminase TadA [Saccharopolyspora kobensis]|uniref:tRNA(Arg) A34 adenosine deaminase TadA n=1 Tax=Saccharopolyspora kobensis TaxID=146035 RepID=A0A1H6E6D4_9PSEU|nr:nucleoside deaminase [Saccharopolyspora kobensis]SEG93207.1 tRNA(Arg) A34 adenosine deaminase TadA [Saccharopolyspora kobensis]SFD43475.1 tRNA(Arg) A34 adenosine deaminase TadA [Saccharopolyspora kobensis]